MESRDRIGEASGTRPTKSEEEIDGQSKNKEEVQGEASEAQAVIGASDEDVGV